MSKFLPAILVSLLAAAAHADESKLSLWHCGLQFGDAPKVSQAYSASKQTRQFGSDQVVRSIEVTQPSITTFTKSTSNRTVTSRLPSTFTFAKFVCSW